MRLFSVGRSAVCEPALTLEPAAAGLSVAPRHSASPTPTPISPAPAAGAAARLMQRVGSRLGHRPDAGTGSAPAPGAGRPPLPDRSTARRALGLPLDVPIYAVVGPLDRAAGPDRMWRAWAAVRRRNAEAQLLVMADVPVPALPGVRAVGRVPDLATYLDASDAVLVLARRPGLPGPVIDACGRGVPLITSREAVGKGEACCVGATVCLVDGNHPAQIADALLARWVGTVQWFQAAATTAIGAGQTGWTW